MTTEPLNYDYEQTQRNVADNALREEGYEKGIRHGRLEGLLIGVLAGAFGIGCYYGIYKVITWLLHP